MAILKKEAVVLAYIRLNDLKQQSIIDNPLRDILIMKQESIIESFRRENNLPSNERSDLNEIFSSN